MKHTKIIFLLFLILFMFVSISDGASVLGKWQTQIGSDIVSIEFLDDGTYIRSTTNRDAISPTTTGNYKILKGNRILFENVFGTMVMKYTFSGNELLLINENNSRDKMKLHRTSTAPTDEQFRKKAEEINTQYQKNLEKAKKQSNKESSKDGGFSLFKNKIFQGKNEYNQSAKSDLKNAYTASQAYFRDNQNGILTLKELPNYGYRASPGVTLDIINGDNHRLRLAARHKEGNITYMTDQKGTIIEQQSPVDVNIDAKKSDTAKTSDTKKVDNDLRRSEYGRILDEKDKNIISDFLLNNPSYRIASKKDNLDKYCLQPGKHPYLFKGNLTGKSNKDIVACFIDSNVKPGTYIDNKGFRRSRGQFVIVVFSITDNGNYQPFVLEKEFALEGGNIFPVKKSLIVQPKCESGGSISYKWKKEKFVKDIMYD